MQEEKQEKTGPWTVANLAKQLLQDILDKMGFKAKATGALATDEQIILDINAPDLGLLIGNEGETINALQTLVRAITAPENPDRIPILLDAEGYRDRRAKTLRDQALAMRDKVKDTGKEAVMYGLTAYERRLVHLALANDPDVTTYSEGEGSERILIVSPSK